MKIRGIVKKINYPEKVDKNMETLRMIFLIKSEDDGITYKAQGYIVPLEKGDYIELEGAKEGNQIHFSDYFFVEEEEKGAIFVLKFLFGQKNAYKIMQVFDNSATDAIKIFKEREELFKNKVEQIKGISIKKIDKAYEKYAKNKTAELLYNQFKNYTVSFEECVSIYRKLGERALEKIKSNPYLLCFDFNIPFNSVDKIATEVFNVDKMSQKRLFAGTYYCLQQSQKQGNVFEFMEKNGTKNGLVTQVSQLLKTDENVTKEIMYKLESHNKIVIEKMDGNEIVYTKTSFETEKNIAEKLYDLNKKCEFNEEKLVEMIKNYEKENNIDLAELQKKAILNSLSNNISVITGPAGSGKTTIINAIITIYEKLSKSKIFLCAPTGKAAYRMSENTKREAFTIHRLLKYSPVTHDFEFNESNKLDCDLLVIDEVSMLGNYIFSKLLDALPNECTVILVGDSEQLPSIDYGKVLEDIICSDRIPFIELDTVYRQSNESSLLKVIQDISQGKELDVEEKKDYLFISKKKENTILNALLARYDEALSITKNVKNVILLTPTNKGTIGTNNLNRIIQEKVNPAGYGREETKFGKTVFRVGDIVIQCKNEKGFNVFNGMVGEITRIHTSSNEYDLEYMEVKFPDGVIEYTRDRYDNLKLAYALTIHKTQGSEYDRVILAVSEESLHMLDRRIIYTAVSRAKKHLTIIGDKTIYDNAIKKGGKIKRNSLLSWRIRERITSY